MAEPTSEIFNFNPAAQGELLAQAMLFDDMADTLRAAQEVAKLTAEPGNRGHEAAGEHLDGMGFVLAQAMSEYDPATDGANADTALGKGGVVNAWALSFTAKGIVHLRYGRGGEPDGGRRVELSEIPGLVETGAIGARGVLAYVLAQRSRPKGSLSRLA